MKARLAEALKHCAGMADKLRPPPDGVVVLIYHRVGRRTPLEVDLDTALFEEQMASLAEGSHPITLDAALERLEASSGGNGQVVVTFDDGTADFADTALPIMLRHQVPSTLYVATDFVDRGIDFPMHGTPLSWNALRDIVSTGLVTVGTHTHTHALLDRLDDRSIAEELSRSDELIGEQLGVTPLHFAYPKAVAGSSAADVAVRARYRSAALAGTRANRYGRTDFHRLARSPIQQSDGMRWFGAKVAGGMRLEDDARTVANRWRYRRAST